MALTFRTRRRRHIVYLSLLITGLLLGILAAVFLGDLIYTLFYQTTGKHYANNFFLLFAIWVGILILFACRREWRVLAFGFLGATLLFMLPLFFVLNFNPIGVVVGIVVAVVVLFLVALMARNI